MTKDPSVARLETFLRRWGLSRRKGGEVLGTTERMIYLYLAGTHRVPETISLLIKSLEENWREKSKIQK